MEPERRALFLSKETCYRFDKAVDNSDLNLNSAWNFRDLTDSYMDAVVSCRGLADLGFVGPTA